MTDEVQTFEAVQAHVTLQMASFGLQLQGEQGRIASLLNAASDFPIPGIDLLPGGGGLEAAIDKWNNQIVPETGNAWDELTGGLWDAIGQLAGSPLELLEHARSFSRVKPLVYNESELNQMLVIFKRDWKGAAADSYEAVAKEQRDALLALSTACDNGAQMTAGVANQILNLWRKLIREFGSWLTDIIEVFASMTEIDNILSFEVPSILRAVKLVLQNILDLADILAEYLINQLTGSVSWQQLAAGAPGLPSNHWPTVREANSDSINDPGQWTPQSA